MTDAFKTFGRLESQPNFPFVDLSDNNAMMTAVMVTNAGFTGATHTQSENIIATFRFTHPAIHRGAEFALEDPTKLRAINYGAAVFEVIAALVTAFPDVDMPDLVLTTGSFAASRDRSALMRYLYSAEDSFITEMPRTTEVVKEAAQAGNASTAYALLGAALTRKLSIDAETAKGELIFDLS